MGKILVADDDQAVRHVVAAALEAAGHAVAQVGDGPAAVIALDPGSFDLLITDLNMPEFGGLELLVFLQDSAHPVPVIVISGSWTARKRREAEMLGAVRIFEKGALDLGELVVVVQRLLSVR